MQVVSESTEMVYCADDAAARLKQRNNFSINSFQLLYRLDDVSIIIGSLEILYGAKMVFTHLAITLPKVNRFG